MEKIPVIIINWNGIKDTVECIESVLEQRFQDFIIYLVDNGSDNDEFERLSERYSNCPQVALIKNEINLGFTLAHNRIFEQLNGSSAEFVVLLNNDTVAEKEWLAELLAMAKEEEADMVGSFMVNYYDRTLIDSAGLFLLSTGEILPIGHDHKIDNLPKNLFPVATCGGACLYRMSMLNEIGIFDPYFSTGYEDAELGLRAFLAGKKISICREAIVYHKMSRSVNKIFNRRKAQKIQEDINYTYLKLMPIGAIVINALTNVPRWIIMMLIHLIALRFRFITVQAGAIIKFLGDIKVIISARAEFRKLRRKNAIEILKIQPFFAEYDLKRFISFIIKRRKNQFEKY